MKSNAGRKMINRKCLCTSARLKTNRRFKGGRKEIVTNAKYGKNELFNSIPHIRNSIIW
jgi:hypothetical protein